jgi:hypothetical protein
MEPKGKKEREKRQDGSNEVVGVVGAVHTAVQKKSTRTPFFFLGVRL